MGLKVIKVSYYRKNCIGCGTCSLLCPQNWKMNEEDGLADLINSVDKGVCFTGEIMEVDLDDNLKVQEECPVHCIKVNN